MSKMAVKKENPEVDVAEEPCRPIELITENGFSIVRSDEIEGATLPPDGKYSFLVRDPRGNELEIIVGIVRKAVNEITWRSRGRISSKSSYWICCAERHLADYLWENDNYPPDATLKVELLTPHDINLARRWGTPESR